MADELVGWKVDGNEPLSLIHWGLVAAGSSADRTFRVKNASTLYTAYDVVVIAESVDHYLSLDGRLFTASISLGDLRPSGISAVITVRRVTPSSATLGDISQLTLQPTSWGME